MDGVISNGLQPSVSTPVRLEADSAVAAVPDMTNTEGSQSSCEVTPAARTGPTVDSAREVSVSDGLTRREDRHHSGNLSTVSEESGPKSLYQGSFFV